MYYFIQEFARREPKTERYCIFQNLQTLLSLHIAQDNGVFLYILLKVKNYQKYI